MTVFEYGNPNMGIVLVQPVDDHDMSVIDSEVRYIRELTDQEFGLRQRSQVHPGTDGSGIRSHRC